MKRSKFIAILALGLGLTLLAAACSHSGDSGDSYDGTPGNLDLRLPVEDVPAGTILDSEELNLGEGAVGHRILYASRDLKNNAPIAVSGYVITKSGDAPEGGWPLVAWAHGTVGLADVCAPSADVENDRELWEAVLEEGYAIVATDYEGLGTPGLHPYIVGESEARGVFDSVRAVQKGNLKGINVSDKWVAWGHSQGGHAAMFVAQTWKSYAPESNLIGVVAGAPPSQFNILYNFLIGGPFQGYIVMATAGAAVSYDLPLEDVLAQTSLDLLPVLDEGCTDKVFDAYNSLSKEEISPHDDPFAVEPTKSIVEKMDTKTLPIQAPVLIIHGDEDEQIPFASSQGLLLQQCAMLPDGVTIQRFTYAGHNHGSVIPASRQNMFNWIEERFSGASIESDCS